MANLHSQYTSGNQFTAGTIAGSALGVSGLNPIVDRLNSITSDDGVYSNLGSGTGISIGAGSVVELTNKTSYYALNGGHFKPVQPNIDNVYYHDDDNSINLSANITDGTIKAPVNLPHGAVVTSCIVYANDSSSTWSLNAGTTQMATAACNSSDSTISSATINNTSAFENNYFIKITGLTSGDYVYWAGITYTTDYD